MYGGVNNHCTTQQPFFPELCEEYGSSFFATGPHTDGTCEEIRQRVSKMWINKDRLSEKGMCSGSARGGVTRFRRRHVRAGELRG